MRSILAALLVLVAWPAWAQCPSTWRSHSPAYNVDCLSAAKPYACGGGDTGAPKCVAAGAIPACTPGVTSLSCTTCTCVAVPTPTPGSGAGGCTPQTLTRTDANTYAFSPTVTSLEWCRIDQSDVALNPGTPGQNQAQLSGSNLELGFFVNAGAVVRCCGS